MEEKDLTVTQDELVEEVETKKKENGFVTFLKKVGNVFKKLINLFDKEKRLS